MGSFNSSCIASRQTIAPGDSCWVLPIIQSSTYRPVQVEHRGESHAIFGISSSTCYPCAYWTPFGGLIEADYDDYGQFQVKDTQVNRIRITRFFLDLLADPVKVLQGENSVHDVPFDLYSLVSTKESLVPYLLDRDASFEELLEEPASVFEDMVEIWNGIWDVAQEHRLFGLNRDGALRPVQFAAMHASAVEALVSQVPDANYRRESLDQRVVFSEAVEHGEMLAKTIPVRDTFNLGFESRIRYIGYFSGMRYPSEDDELAVFGGQYLERRITLDVFFDKMKPALDTRYLMTGLNELNLKLTPLEYATQDYSNAIGRAYERFVSKVATIVSEGRAYDDEAQDDDDMAQAGSSDATS